MFIEISSSVFLLEEFCIWKHCGKVVVCMICHLIVVAKLTSDASKYLQKPASVFIVTKQSVRLQKGGKLSSSISFNSSCNIKIRWAKFIFYYIKLILNILKIRTDFFFSQVLLQ